MRNYLLITYICEIINRWFKDSHLHGKTVNDRLFLGSR